MFGLMKKRKTPAKKAVAAKAKPKAVKAAVPKPVAKPVGREWGAGPWAVPVQKTVMAKAVMVAARPSLEDVFNHQVKRQYRPLERLRTPQAVRWVRVGLICLAIVAWLAAVIFHKS